MSVSHVLQLDEMKAHYEKEWKKIAQLLDSDGLGDLIREDHDLHGEIEDFTGIIAENLCEGIRLMSKLMQEVDAKGILLKAKLDKLKKNALHK